MNDNKKYVHFEVENDIQEKWKKADVYDVNLNDDSKEKFYLLDMWPYPSGDGLHMGHSEVYTISDTYYRFKRMRGFNVLHPQGFDAFGLPAENYAIKTGTHPSVTTKQNSDNYLRQWADLGMGHDFSKLVYSNDEKTYKWTQWLFGEFFKNDIAYKKIAKANWCNSCNTIIANEQIENGACERCGTDIEQKDIPSWMFRITDFADDLIWDDKNKDINWPEYTKKNQNAWIGKSSGSNIKFPVVFENQKQEINFTRDVVKKDLVFKGEEKKNVYFVHTDKAYADTNFKEDVETFERVVPFAIVKNPKTNEILCLDWQKTGWKALPAGGIDEGEDVLEAIKREVLEETGYKNINFIKKIPGEFYQKFYRPHKGSNVFSKHEIFYFELENEEKEEVSKEELEKHVAVWIKEEKVKDFLTVTGPQTVWDLYLNDKKNRSKYLVIEKSLPKDAKDEIQKIAVLTPQKFVDEEWGWTWNVEVDTEKEQEFLKYVSDNLVKKGFYVDSIGTSNYVIFPGEYFKIENEEDYGKFKEAGRKINIPEEQLKLDWKQQNKDKIEVFTTRPDTLFGATYMVLAPEHKLVQKWKDKITNWKEVEEYINNTKKKTELERLESKEKTGVELKGVKAINPARKRANMDNAEIPIFISDYVLAGYGTGAIMAVPAHDERDCEFAKKFNIPIKPVILKQTEKSHSFIMGTKNISKEGLEEIGVEIVEETEKGFLKVLIPFEKLEEYKNFIRENMENGFWNEFSTKNDFYFIFKHKNGEIEEFELNLETNDKIDEYGWSFNDLEVKKPAENVYSWLLDGGDGFYKEILGSTEYGVLINSGEFDGMNSEEAKEKITEFVGGKMTSTYRLRDWSISRQRYWGTPIPIVYNKEIQKKAEMAVKINFYDEVIWERLINGDKKIETRAMGKEKGFENLKINDYLKAINKNTEKEIYLKITKIWKFKNLEELFENKEVLTKVYAPNKPVETIEELKKGYSYTDDYLERIEKNGLIAWEIEVEKTPGVKFVGEENLPWLLPTDVDFVPTGEAPLAKSKELKERAKKLFGKGWTPEVDTMDTFVDSSWYFLRYIDPFNDAEFASKESIKKWMPVDLYIGGREHTYMHLLFARFFVKAMKKIGLVDFDEPFLKLVHQGLVRDKNGAKMSKSKGNVVNPDEMVKRFGADATRAYILFTGPVEDDVVWNEDNIVGIYRWIEKIWRQQEKLTNNENLKFKKELHKTIKLVTENFEKLRFNVVVSDIMKLVNIADRENKINKDDYLELIKIVSPLVPHVSEKIFSNLNSKNFLIQNNWPDFDQKLVIDDKIKLMVQVNGKKRGEIEVSPNAEESEAVEKTKENLEIAKWLDGDIKKVIYIKGRILNFVVI